MHDNHLLKIGVPAATGRFHPKVYVFTQASDTLCWVGSANLTDAGFGRNVELVSEFVDDGSTRAWMDEQWALSGIPTTEWLNSYEEGWLARQARDQAAEKVPRLHPPATAPVAASLIILLGPRASRAMVEPLMRSAEQDPRIHTAEDFKSMCRELLDSDYRAISLRSFLWLIGWCNTDVAYRTASNIYAKPLAQGMFGYVPEQLLRVGPATIDLKQFRYGRIRDADAINTLVEYHRNHLS